MPIIYCKKKNKKTIQDLYFIEVMERIINVHIEKLPEGGYVASSDDIQGLIAQGRTVTEVLEIARDVARRLLEAREERRQETVASITDDSFDCSLVVGV